jgi:hypothetical protein
MRFLFPRELRHYAIGVPLLLEQTTQPATHMQPSDAGSWL